MVITGKNKFLLIANLLNWSVFAYMHLKFARNDKMTKKFLKKFNMGIFKKMLPKKVIVCVRILRFSVFTNFFEFFAYNFLEEHYFETTSMNLKSTANSAYFGTYIEFSKKKPFWGHKSTF
jgi:hypothetical protein